jgi:hypothetical protein
MAHFRPTKALFSCEFVDWGQWGRSERVLKQLVPALLLVVPATSALWGGTGFVQATEECRARPGSTAPQGSGWYYRVNRADHRRCWFLGAKNASAHFARRGYFAGDSTGGVRQEQQAGAQPQVVSSNIELADDSLRTARTTVPPATAPTFDAVTSYLVPRSVPTVSFRQLSPDAKAPISAAEQPSKGVGNFIFAPVSPTEAAATGLLFIGGGLFLSHLLRRRSRKQTILRAGDLGRAAPFVPPVVRAPPMAPKLSNTRRVTADDVTQSLRELRRTLRRAETSIQRRFSECDISNN